MSHCSTPQPGRPSVGQEWKNLATGRHYVVKAVHGSRVTILSRETGNRETVDVVDLMASARLCAPRRVNPGRREPSRVRQRGTRVTAPTSPQDRIDALRRIVAESQYAKIDGMMVDLFSASAIVSVFDAISPANQAKYAAMPVSQMASIAFKLLKKDNPKGYFHGGTLAADGWVEMTRAQWAKVHRDFKGYASAWTEFGQRVGEGTPSVMGREEPGGTGLYPVRIVDARNLGRRMPKTNPSRSIGARYARSAERLTRGRKERRTKARLIAGKGSYAQLRHVFDSNAVRRILRTGSSRARGYRSPDARGFGERGRPRSNPRSVASYVAELVANGNRYHFGKVGIEDFHRAQVALWQGRVPERLGVPYWDNPRARNNPRNNPRVPGTAYRLTGQVTGRLTPVRRRRATTPPLEAPTALALVRTPRVRAPRAPRGKDFQPLERVTVPYTGRSSYGGHSVKRVRERAAVQGYVDDVNGERMVMVSVPRGKSTEVHTFPERLVRRRPHRDYRSPTSKASDLRSALEADIAGDAEKGRAMLDQAHEDYDLTEATARAAAPGSPDYTRARRALRLLEVRRDLLESIVTALTGGEADPFAIANRRRRRNPRSGSELERARRTFEKWHENAPRKAVRMKGPSRTIPKTLVGLGRLVSFVYESDKFAGGPDNPTGKRLLYEHETKAPRPVLATDPDGDAVHIVGGRMKVTADGFVN
jgi:hypothetical protein